MLGAPVNLRANGCVDPLGLAGQVYLSWWVSDIRSAEIQSAYEIEVASSLELLRSDTPDLWQPGAHSSAQMAHVPYGGVALFSEQSAWWRVRTYDSDGLPSPWSTPGFFEMGLLTESEWTGAWISPFVHGNRFQGNAVARVRKEFELAEDCRRARLYVGVIGACRISVNDQDMTSEPIGAWADFSDYHYYEVLDVTQELNAGRNRIEVLLSDGYACGMLPGIGREVFSYRPAVRCMMLIEGISSRRYEIVSDRSWSWLPSSITDAQTLLGEHMDGRRFVSDWVGVEVGSLPVQVLDIASRPVARLGPARVRSKEALHAPVRRYSQIQVAGPPYMILEYDVGRVVTGAVQLELVGREPDGVEISYSLDRSFQECTRDTITTAGSRSSEVYVSSFARHSFRWLRIRYTQGLTLPGIVSVHSSIPACFFGSRIETDSEPLSALLSSIDTTCELITRSAPLHGVKPGERLPDLGQAASWAPELAWDPENRVLLDKWLRDASEGFRHYTNSAPYSGGRVPMPRDTDEYARLETLLAILWTRYQIDRDAQALRVCYPEVRALVLGFRHMAEDGLRTEFREDLYGADADAILVANVTLLVAFRTFLLIADVLAEDTDRILGQRVFDELADAFQNRFLSANGRLVQESQATLVAAITSGVLADDELERCRVQLVSILQTADFRIDLPPILVRHLLPVLSDAGRHDLAYRMLLHDEPISWLGFVNRGLGVIGRAGQAHVAEVGILAWILRYLVGIRAVPEDLQRNGRYVVGFKPMPPLGPLNRGDAPLSSVRCTLPTPCGELGVQWRTGEAGFSATLSVPVNCIVQVAMPDGSSSQVSTGLHELVVDFTEAGDGVPTLLDSAEQA